MQNKQHYCHTTEPNRYVPFLSMSSMHISPQVPQNIYVETVIHSSSLMMQWLKIIVLNMQYLDQRSFHF
jgi:hypothetical protein